MEGGVSRWKGWVLRRTSLEEECAGGGAFLLGGGGLLNLLLQQRRGAPFPADLPKSRPWE